MPRYTPPDYQWEDDWLVQKYTQSTGDELAFQAENIRHDRTGAHAHVRATWNGMALNVSVINTDRHESRTTFINKAKKQLAERGQKPDMAPHDIDHAFDLFCEGLEEQQTNVHMGKVMNGTDINPVRQLVRGLVVEGGGTAIYAPPGRGKTYCLLCMAVCIDAGISVPGVIDVLRPEKVLFLNLERSAASMQYRLGCVNRALGQDVNRGLLFMNERGRSLKDLERAVKDTMRKHGCKVLALDSLSRVGSGSMVDDEDSNNAMDLMNRLAPTWLLSAHTARSDESHIFGSVMFDAAIDVGVRLTSQQGENKTGVGLKVSKENDLGPQPLRVLALEFGSGLVGVRRAYSGEFPEVEGSAKKPPLVEDVLQYLLEEGFASADQIGLALGKDRSVISRVLRGKEHEHLFIEKKEGRTVKYAVRTKREAAVGD